MWELACLRCRHLDLPEKTGSKCGSGLAREGGVSATTCIDWHTAFASKPAPTFLIQFIQVDRGEAIAGKPAPTLDRVGF